MAKEKVLMITHDGDITVSQFTPLALGEVPLHKAISTAMGLTELDYKHIEAKVTVSITFKENKPNVYWEEDDRC